MGQTCTILLGDQTGGLEMLEGMISFLEKRAFQTNPQSRKESGWDVGKSKFSCVNRPSMSSRSREWALPGLKLDHLLGEEGRPGKQAEKGPTIGKLGNICFLHGTVKGVNLSLRPRNQSSDPTGSEHKANTKRSVNTAPMWISFLFPSFPKESFVPLENTKGQYHSPLSCGCVCTYALTTTESVSEDFGG